MARAEIRIADFPEIQAALAESATAIRLLNEALHLRMNGEHAPGGDETWADWERRTQAFLTDRIARLLAFRSSLRGEPAEPA